MARLKDMSRTEEVTLTLPPRALGYVKAAVAAHAEHAQRSAELATDLLPEPDAARAHSRADRAAAFASTLRLSAGHLTGDRRELALVFTDHLAETAGELADRAGGLVHELEAGHAVGLPSAVRHMTDRIAVLTSLLGQLGEQS